MLPKKEMPRRIVIGCIISACVFSFVFTLRAFNFFHETEQASLDYRFNLRGVEAVPDTIVIVAIDDNSVSENHLGRWPWSRSVHAGLVDFLYEAGAKVVAFDILFSEPDRLDPQGDLMYAMAVARAGNVVNSMSMQLEGMRVKGIIRPLPAIEQGSARVGFVNHFPEVDGVFRKMMPRIVNNNTVYYSFAMQVASLYRDIPPEKIMQQLSLDKYGEMTVNYTGGFKNFRYISYADVVDGNVPKAFFRGKLVLVGAIATALFDKYPMPFAQSFPGIEIHANTITNLLNNNEIIPTSPRTTLLISAAMALCIGCVLPVVSPLFALLIIVLLFSSYSFVCYYVFANMNLWLEWIVPITVLLLSYAGIIFSRFVTEIREKNHIKKTFGYYVSPHVMEDILSDPDKITLGGKKKELTILFSDIRNFTTISESLPPEEVVQILNEYLTEMTRIVFAYQGTVDKFIGDAVMAFWGAPLPQEDHALLACQCGFAMMRTLDELMARWAAEGRKTFDIGVGINTGEVVVGNMGSQERMDYTVIGDSVNLASRLEGLNKTYHTHIIIGENTYQKVKNIVTVQSLGGVKVKGKEKEVMIYELKDIAIGAQSNQTPGSIKK